MYIPETCCPNCPRSKLFLKGCESTTVDQPRCSRYHIRFVSLSMGASLKHLAIHEDISNISAGKLDLVHQYHEYLDSLVEFWKLKWLVILGLIQHILEHHRRNMIFFRKALKLGHSMSAPSVADVGWKAGATRQFCARCRQQCRRLGLAKLQASVFVYHSSGGFVGSFRLYPNFGDKQLLKTQLIGAWKKQNGFNTQALLRSDVVGTMFI